MKITSIAEARHVPFDLEGYIMYASEELEIIHLCLQSGQEIALHLNPFRVIITLIKGEVTLMLEEKPIPLTLYDVVEVEATIKRGFVNAGASEARIIITKIL